MPTSPKAARTPWSTPSWRGATPTAIAAHIQQYFDAGADHVCLQPVTEIRPLFDGPDTSALDVLRRLAPTVTELGRIDSPSGRS